jgi:hypothetical protein
MVPVSSASAHPAPGLVWALDQEWHVGHRVHDLGPHFGSQRQPITGRK